MDNTFPMGFWGTQSIDDVPLNDVADWAACGMTLTVAPHYSPDPVRKQKLLALLDECHRHGIRLILSDSRTTWRSAASPMITIKNTSPFSITISARTVCSI